VGGSQGVHVKRFIDSWIRTTAWLVLLASVAAPSRTFAEEAAMTPARQLFNDARQLAADGRYEEACPKFEKSLRLELGIGTQFNLADCWERIGRTASAHALFLGAAASAKAGGQLEREQVLRERAMALEPRLTRLVVEVQDSDPKLSVTRGDLPLEADSFGKALPVDPGKYVFVARAPGKKRWEQPVEIEPGAPLVKIQVPKLEREEPESATRRSAPAKKLAPPASREAQQSDRSLQLNYKALSIGVLGVGFIGVGSAMGLQYLNANDSAKSTCPSSNDCSRAELKDHARFVNSARQARTWSYVGFTAGAVTLAGAAALWIFDKPKPEKTKASFSAAPLVGTNGAVGATAAGTF
jgi:hypothetical protein